MAYNQPIQRRLVAAVTKEYEQRGQVAPQQTTQEQTPVMLPTVFFGYNSDTSGGPIEPESRLFVWDFWPPTLSYANAVKQIYRNKIKLMVGRYPSDKRDDGTDLYALTPAKINRICQFYSRSNSFYFAHVYVAVPEVNYRYVDINGVATNDEENAYAEIRFATPIVNNYAVAFCKRIVKEGLQNGEEVLAELNVNTADTVTKVTTQTSSIEIPTGVTVETTPKGNVELTLSDDSQAGVQVVVDIQAVNGALGVRRQGLSATFTGTTEGATVGITKSRTTVVTGVTTEEKKRVTSVTAKS